MKKHYIYNGLIFVVIFILCFIKYKNNSNLQQIRLDIANRIDNLIVNYDDSNNNKKSDMMNAMNFILNNCKGHRGVSEEKYNQLRLYFENWSDCDRKASEIADSIDNIYGKITFNSLNFLLDEDELSSDEFWYYLNEIIRIKNSYPWCREIIESDFKEFVLPYRISNEPLNLQWRTEIIRHFTYEIDSACNQKSKNVIDVAQTIMNKWNTKPFKWTSKFPQGVSMGVKNVFLKNGSCREFAEGVVLLMRAIGIPAGIDMVLVRGDANSAHSWPFILDENHKCYITSIENSVWDNTKTLDIPATKIYRLCFSKQDNSYSFSMDKSITDNIHPTFRDMRMIDVTNEYFPIYNIKISLRYSPSNESNPIYICNTSKDSWIPVGMGLIRNGYAEFNNVASSSAACIVSEWDGNTMVPLTYPFVIESGGTIREIVQNNTMMAATLFCKFPLSSRNGDVVDRMVGGVVEVSMDPDFRNVDTLLQILHSPIRKINRIPISNREKYRYIRYKGSDNSYCNIAELEVYVDGLDYNIAPSCKKYGTPGDKSGKGTHEFPNVFDGNIDTSFDYTFPSGGWSAIDMGKPRKINKLVYCPRNRDNFVKKGDKYELFYWNTINRSWISMGIKIANSDSIDYIIPSGALLYLKNHTGGNDERIFEFDNLKRIQIFH